MAKKSARTKVAAVSPVRLFKTKEAFASWLDKNHAKSPGIWMRLGRKGSGIKSTNHAEALEVALCYGWIDALARSENEKTYLQRFLPRRPKSLWSKINREKALALIESGQMRPAGLAEVERAKSDGRWDAAYDSPANAQVPEEFQRELDRRPKAKAFFETLSKVNRYAIIWRIQTAKKPETRERKIRTLIEMLEKGETIH